ncbi:uncharacterized protein LTR77_005199 [Saxophila tyrrhenica]|uniref:Uncharacterized protein n=1 Tax=Saxophila tyrrhenica TaxID=1690608 RepID=A0AAV9PFK6_9PEZI|nr:hypothetical protein LTR77_005199 [Saxophila tyrrhenica]
MESTADVQPSESRLSNIVQLLQIVGPSSESHRCVAHVDTSKVRCMNIVDSSELTDAYAALRQLCAPAPTPTTPLKIRKQLKTIATNLICHDPKHQRQAWQIAHRWREALTSHTNGETCSPCPHVFLDTRPIQEEWPPRLWKNLAMLVIFAWLYGFSGWEMVAGLMALMAIGAGGIWVMDAVELGEWEDWFGEPGPCLGLF